MLGGELDGQLQLLGVEDGGGLLPARQLVDDGVDLGLGGGDGLLASALPLLEGEGLLLLQDSDLRLLLGCPQFSF